MMVGTSQHELGIPFIGFLMGLMANSILYTWLYNNTKQSLWSAILLHWLYTCAVQVMSFGVTRSPLYNWLECLPYVTMAAIVVLIWKPQALSRPQKTLGYTDTKSDKSDESAKYVRTRITNEGFSLRDSNKYTRGNTPVLGGFSDKRQAIELNTQCISVVAYMMLALDVLIICLSSQVFDRKSILTLWR